MEIILTAIGIIIIAGLIKKAFNLVKWAIIIGIAVMIYKFIEPMLKLKKLKIKEEYEYKIGNK